MRYNQNYKERGTHYVTKLHPPNLRKNKPNQKWCTDLHITSDLAIRTLQKALDSQYLEKGGLILHSDQGSVIKKLDHYNISFSHHSGRNAKEP